MNIYPRYVCNNIQEVHDACEQLDKATLVDIQIVDGGIIKPVTNYKGIYNISKGLFTAAVVPYYHVIQHKDYFNFFAESLQRLNIKYTMTVTQMNNKAQADIEFIGRNIEFKNLNEEFTTGIRLINSYDKSAGIFIVPKFTRLACTNGMIVSREQEFSIRHHSKMAEEIESYVEKTLNRIINEAQDLRILVSSSMTDSIEWERCCKIFEKLITQVKHREQILKILGIDIIEVKDRTSGKKSISYVWSSNADKKEKFDRWTLYNCVTMYATHGEQLSPIIENHMQYKAEKLLTTPLIEMPYK